MVLALAAVGLSITVSTNQHSIMLSSSIFKHTDVSTQCLSVVSLAHTLAAFSRKHSENSSGFQLLQVITLHDLYRKAKHKFQFKFWGNFFQPQTPQKSEEMNHITLKLLSVRANNYPGITIYFALHPHLTHTGAEWASFHAADMSRHVTLILIHTEQRSMHDADSHIWKTASCFPWYAIALMNLFICFQNISRNINSRQLAKILNRLGQTLELLKLKLRKSKVKSCEFKILLG